jgi:hypothetical protein
MLRYRHQTLCLDSSLALTRGESLGLSGITANLNPLQGVYTGVCSPGKHGRRSGGSSGPLFGQIRYVLGARTARLAFLLPADRLNAISLPALLEHLTIQAGKWGAFHFLAEVDEHTTAFEGLRRASFSVYAWQRIWRLPGEPPAVSSTGNGTVGRCWQPVRDSDTIAVRSLYQSLVPSLVQPMEGVLEKRLRGLVCVETPPHAHPGSIQAYVEIVSGPRGIWVQPYVHPDIQDPRGLIADLVPHIPRFTSGSHSRPIYVCVRSYQSWLELALQELEADTGPRQALMVKHLAISQRATQALRIPSLENGRPEPSAPIVRLDRSRIDPRK